MQKLIKIGEASKILGVSPEVLRYWEKTQRIKSYRMPTGHRKYDLEDIEKIKEDMKPK